MSSENPGDIIYIQRRGGKQWVWEDYTSNEHPEPDEERNGVLNGIFDDMDFDTFGDASYYACGVAKAKNIQLRVLEDYDPDHDVSKPISAQDRVVILRQDLHDKWPTPTPMDSWTYLVTEVAEVGDVMLRLGYGERGDYARNNEKKVDLGAEMGDVYLMLCTLANSLLINLDDELGKKMDYLREKYK